MIIKPPGLLSESLNPRLIHQLHLFPLLPPPKKSQSLKALRLNKPPIPKLLKWISLSRHSAHCARPSAPFILLWLQGTVPAAASLSPRVRYLLLQGSPPQVSAPNNRVLVNPYPPNLAARTMAPYRRLTVLPVPRRLARPRPRPSPRRAWVRCPRILSRPDPLPTKLLRNRQLPPLRRPLTQCRVRPSRLAPHRHRSAKPAD